MKVFLSWSGNESRQLAEIFKEWLPNVLQYIDPYMSSKDISLGERWNNSITDNLNESSYGLVFVTPANINSPWINYEAGALSKTMDSKVVPILYEAEVVILNDGPLKQFQSAKDLKEESILSLVRSINAANKEGKIDESRLEKAFNMWWSTLNRNIQNITKEENGNKDLSEHEPSEKEMLRVMLTKLNEQEKILNKSKINHRSSTVIYPPKLIDDLVFSLDAIMISRTVIDEGSYDKDLLNLLESSVEKMDRAIDYMKARNVNPTYRGVKD